MATGANMYIAYDKEQTLGGNGVGNAKKIPVIAGSEIVINRGSFESQSLRNDRAIDGHKLGMKKPTVNISLEARSLLLDDIIELATFGTWSNKITNQARTVDFVKSTGTILGITSIDCSAGDVIKISASEKTTNNRQWIVKSANENSIDVYNIDKSGNNMMDDAADDDIVFDVYSKIKIGQTVKSAKFEEALTDISLYTLAEMCVCSQMSMDFTPEQIIKMSANFVSGKLAADSPRATPYLVANQATAGELLDGYTGDVYIDDEHSNIVTAFNVQIENNPEVLYAIFNDTANDIKAGRIRISGKMTVFLEDGVMLAKYNSETPVKIVVLCKDKNDKGYMITIKNAKITGAPKTVSENNILLNLNYLALPVGNDLGFEIVKLD